MVLHVEVMRLKHVATDKACDSRVHFINLVPSGVQSCSPAAQVRARSGAAAQYRRPDRDQDTHNEAKCDKVQLQVTSLGAKRENTLLKVAALRGGCVVETERLTPGPRV